MNPKISWSYKYLMMFSRANLVETETIKIILTLATGAVAMIPYPFPGVGTRRIHGSH